MQRGWQLIARFILRQRVPILIAIAALTVFWGFQINLELAHDYAKVIPESNPEYKEYKRFKEEFGEDGNALIIGLEGNIFTEKALNRLDDLAEKLKKAPAVTGVLGLRNLQEIHYDTLSDQFKMRPIAEQDVASEEEALALRQKVLDLPFYQGLITNDSMTATLIAVTIDRKRLDTYEKIAIVDSIVAITEVEAQLADLKTHYSGLPFIRVYTTKKIPKEMVIFLGIAFAITALSLFLFFRSMSAVFFPLLVVAIVVVWGLGFMGLFGYKITILSGVLPALITVIGIPNSIYLLTKYHFEFRKTRNKIKSLVLVIQKIGIVTVMTNATTAVGFLVLATTDINMLRDFGLVAGISVVITFFISVMLIPIIFSFLPEPSPRHTKHTESVIIRKVIRWIDYTVSHFRWAIYVATGIIILFSIWGLFKLESYSRMVDDIPKEDKIYSDLGFLEDNFKGVMPFEVVVNTHVEKGIFKMAYLKKIDRAQEMIEAYPEMSRSLSIVDLLKFARQAWLSGVAAEYQLPISAEAQEIARIYGNSDLGGAMGTKVIFDSLQSKARISAQVRDVGSIRLSEIIDTLYQDLTQLFVLNTPSGRLEQGATYELYGSDTFRIEYAGKEYHGGERFTVAGDSAYRLLSDSTVKGKVDYADRIKVTGTTRIFIKSNEYLVSNLIQSLIIAFIIIAVLMALLFGSLKMVVIALFPNLLPLMLTAGLMGALGIPLKPSSALIFSVAFGIAVDDTIHYLARYRLARKTGDTVSGAISNSFKDTGVSMIYTSIILLVGFVIFAFSTYGGIQSLGKLTSMTIGIALFSNLLLLPALLRTLQKDDEVLADGMMDYEEEAEDVEALKELIGSDETESDENGDTNTGNDT